MNSVTQIADFTILSINPLMSNVTYSHTLKTSENLRFSDVFGGGGYKKVPLDIDGLTGD